MRIESEEIEEHLDLEFWLEREGHAFKPTRGVNGMQYQLRECPSCGDRRWRTYVNAETGKGNCFVCSTVWMSKINFIHATMGLSWRETFQHLQEVLKEQGWRPKRKTTAGVEFGKVVLPLSFPLPTAEGENLLYLEKRDVSGELAKFFHLRFCEEGWWNFKKEDGSTGGQNFAMRIIIPVFDLDGTLVTFQGRDITGDSPQKYLFPKELPGTGRFLYNGQNAIRAKRVLMAEGAFDVIAAKRALDEDVGLRDVVPVGSFGKHLSYGSMDGNDQLGRFLQLRREGLQEVTIMYDGEQAALIAALDAAKLLHRLGLRVRIALLPFERDPNEVLPEVVRQAFYRAETYSPMLDMRWRLKNPYSRPVATVSSDCHSAL